MTKTTKTKIEIISNVRCRLLGITPALAKQLDAALSFAVPGANFSPAVRSGRWDGKRHLFFINDEIGGGTFPRGLLERVQALLAEAKVKHEVVDLRKPEHMPVTPKMERLKADMFEGIELRDYQLKAARDAIEKGHGILWLATGGGKTEVASAIIKVLKEQRCLFLVHKKALLTQARERIARRLGTVEEFIGVIGEGRFEPKHITIGTVQTLTRKSSSEAKNKIIDAYLKSIKLVILDEGHHSKADSFYKLLNRIPAPYRYLLSGTPFGSGDALVVEAACGPVVARTSNETLIALGVNARPTIRMIEIKEPAVESASGDWHAVYKEGVVHNTKRNGIIAKRAAKFAKEEKPTLILVRELWHGDLLATMLRTLKVKHSFVHGKMPMNMIEHEKARFEAGNIRVLIASPIFDEGLDIKHVRALIMADGGKSVRSVLQKIGRGLRKKHDGLNVLEVIDFADMTHPWLASHSQERIEIYQEEGFDVVQ